MQCKQEHNWIIIIKLSSKSFLGGDVKTVQSNIANGVSEQFSMSFILYDDDAGWLLRQRGSTLYLNMFKCSLQYELHWLFHTGFFLPQLLALDPWRLQSSNFAQLLTLCQPTILQNLSPWEFLVPKLWGPELEARWIVYCENRKVKQSSKAKHNTVYTTLRRIPKTKTTFRATSSNARWYALNAGIFWILRTFAQCVCVRCCTRGAKRTFLRILKLNCSRKIVHHVNETDRMQQDQWGKHYSLLVSVILWLWWSICLFYDVMVCAHMCVHVHFLHTEFPGTQMKCCNSTQTTRQKGLSFQNDKQAQNKVRTSKFKEQHFEKAFENKKKVFCGYQNEWWTVWMQADSLLNSELNGNFTYWTKHRFVIL